MKPSDTQGYIEIENVAGSIYRLDVRTRSGLPLSFADWIGYANGHKYVAQFIADIPLWYNPTQQSVTVSLASLTMITFPITFPITFGGSLVDETVTQVVAGTWRAYSQIVLTGPMTNLS